MDIQQKPKVSHLSKKEIVAKERWWLWSYIVLALSSIVIYWLLRLHVFEVFGKWGVITQKIALGTFFSTLLLALAKQVEYTVVKRSKVVYTRYNLVRMIRLLSWMLVIAIVISFLFRNWYSAAVSLGLISLILGFALQTPILSFIGWLYILIRQPYHVGDRIQISDFRGDVVEVSYLDTTLWEFSGDYLSNDLPSGRLIRFPNSLVLESAVFNYSWDKFPFIWNEINLHLAYESDFLFVEETMRRVVEEELGEKMTSNLELYRRLVAKTPVDKIDIKEYPYVSFRTHSNTWVEATVTYLVEPKRSAGVRSVLIKKMIAELLAQPDRVMFPKSNAR